MTQPVFQTQRLVVKDRRRIVLSRMTVAGDPGKLLCILSQPSGDAQLLLQTLAGLHKPSSGQLQVLGGNPRSSGVRARLGLRLSPELLDPERSAAEALREVGWMKGIKRQEIELEAAEIVDQLDLHAIGDERVSALPEADQQLLGTAAAFLGHPALILLAGECVLPADTRQQALIQLLKDRTGLGVTIVLADARFAEHCDEVILISDGELIGQASPELIRESVIGLDVEAAERNDTLPQESAFVDICQWILEHPAEMAMRVRRWDSPEASATARG